jgi:ribosomal protein L4
MVIEKFHVLNPKTKEFVKAMDHFKLGKDSVLCVIDEVTENIKRSTSNIPRLRVIDPATLNALDVVNVRKILMSRDSLKIITKRLKNV